MHVLFIIDPLPLLKAYKDSSVAMMQALVTRGHTLSVALQGDLYIEEGKVLVHATPIELIGGADLHDHAWWRETDDAGDRPLSAFDAVLMRKDPPFDMEYVYATHLLEYAQAQGARVFNHGAAIRNHPEKLAITEFPEFTVPTLVTRDMGRIKSFHARHNDVIVKPLDGMGGTGIFRVRADEPNLNAILETLTDDGTRTIMAQRYIPEIIKGDKRILLIGGEPVPYCLARIPLAGETRGNLAAGGRGVAQPLSERDRFIAQAVAPRLAARGLLLVGLDVIGDYVTEINVTSPTCFVEITEQTGFDVPGMFAQALERAVAGLTGTVMTGIVIVVHTPLGSAMLDCAGHVMGPVGDVAVHDIRADDMPDARVPAVVADILRLGQDAGVLVLTDLVGATPANIAKRAVIEAQAKGVQCAVLAGLNTPMLLRALTYRNLPLVETREKALAGGVQGVLRVD